MKKVLSTAAAVALMAVCSTQSPAVVVELIQNGGLENWTGGNPDGWSVVQTDAAGAVNPSPVAHAQDTDVRPGTTGTSSFKLDRAASDYTYRYFLHTNNIPLLAAATSASFSAWQKGPNNRSYVEQSDDNGVTWAAHNTAPLGGHTGSAGWSNVTATITEMANGDTGNVATTVHRIGFHSFSGVSLVDDVSVLGDDGTAPPLSIGSTSPDNDLWLSGTVTITANPTGGSGTYNQVAFDVNGDNTVEFTDTTAPFEFVWNTSSFGTLSSQVVNLKMTVTDSASATGNTTFPFTVENVTGGRQELMTNGNMALWTAGLPNDWSVFQAGAAVITQEAAEGGASGAPSLKINFPAFDAANRHSLRHIGKQNNPGIWQNHQVTYWGKGTNSALGYSTSTDGVTWTTAVDVAAATGLANWSLGIGSVKNPNSNPNEWTTVTTLQLELDAWYDDISWKASNPTASVEQWYQY